MKLGLSSFRRIHALFTFCCLVLSSVALKGVTVDVLVVYTQETLVWHGDENGVVSLAQGCLDKANETFLNSDADVTLRLVAVELTDLKEEGDDFGVDLERISERDGFADAILDRRDEVGADLVCLFRMGPYEGQAGLAYVLRDEGGNSLGGFSVVNARNPLSSNVFAHEIGHNLGAAHDRENASATGLFNYSYGHRFITPSNQTEYRTVMAYSPGWSIDYFSNPDVKFEGVPTGVSGGSSNAADNADTVERGGRIVSKYRATKPIKIVARVGPEYYGEVGSGEMVAEVALVAKAVFSSGESLDWRWSWAGGEARGREASVLFPLGETSVRLVVTDASGGRGEYNAVVVVSERSGMASVVFGGGHGLKLKEDGTLLGKGNNEMGQLGGVGSELWGEWTVINRSVVSMSAYDGLTAYVKEDGTAWVMGYGYPGLTQIATSGAVKVVTSENHTLVLMDDGSLWGIGSNYRGALGIEDKLEMVETLTQIVGSGVVDMAVGDYHSLYVMEDGSLWGMGENLYIGVKRPYNEVIRTPEKVIDGGIRSVSSNFTYSVAIGLDGSVWVAGTNYGGVLGTGDRENKWAFTKVIDSGFREARCERTFCLLVGDDGSLWVTGNIRSSRYDAVVGIEKLTQGRIRSVGRSEKGIMMVRNDGSLWEFQFEPVRENSGDYILPEGASPVLLESGISSKANAAPVANAGENVIIADKDSDGWATVTLDGRQSWDDWKIDSWEWSWSTGSGSGRTLQGSFPVGETVVTLTLTDDEGAVSEDKVVVLVEAYAPSRIVQIDENAGLRLFRHENGTVSANGYDAGGVIVDGTEEQTVHRPRVIWDGVPAVDVSVGDRFILILCEDGSVLGKGIRTFGQMGPNAGDVGDRHLVEIYSEGVVDIAAGKTHSLFLMGDGSVWGVGSNSYGQSGAELSYSSVTPQKIVSDGAMRVSASDRCSVVLMDDGRVLGFGLNDGGRLGDFNLDFRSPQDLGLEQVKKVLAGRDETIALLENGAVLVAKHGFWKPLGSDYGVANRNRFLKGVKDVDTSDQGYILLMEDGSVWAMGTNYNARLGAGGSGNYLDPTVVHQAGVEAISCGDGNCLFVREDGTVWGTGYDWNGVPQAQNELSRLLSAGVIAPFESIVDETPVAFFGGNIERLKQPNWDTINVRIDGSGSTDDWQIVSWEWDLNGAAYTGQYVSVELGAGSYPVSLTVTDLYGKTSTVAGTVKVTDLMVFEDWLATHFSAAELEGMGNSAAGLDPDRDGLSNKAEWEMGLDPLSYKSRAWISSSLDEEGLLMLRLPKMLGIWQPSYRLFSSVDGIAWSLEFVAFEEGGEFIEFVGLKPEKLYRVEVY